MPALARRQSSKLAALGPRRAPLKLGRPARQGHGAAAMPQSSDTRPGRNRDKPNAPWRRSTDSD